MTTFTNVHDAREFLDLLLESEGLEKGESIYIMKKGGSYIVTTDYSAARVLGYSMWTVCHRW